jgi:anhydro-N-acetylmuramic acid kinase
MPYIIGLISGTSVDGIDAALVDVSGTHLDLQVKLMAAKTFPYPSELRSLILEVCAGKSLSMQEMAGLDDAIAQEFAAAAIAIQNGHPIADLIGSHGQTVYHRPPRSGGLGYSLQLGRGEVIAQLTGITTVSNFRAADLAAGGHGAPLVPPVDACLLGHPTLSRCVQNLGGIGNVTYLPATHHHPDFLQQVRGWDTGPGNSLLDLAVQYLSGGKLSFDQEGAWAAQGKPCKPLVDRWLQAEFFRQSPPKSTGREEFGLTYFQTCLQDAACFDLSAADLLATLTELTAASVVHSYRSFLPQLPDQVLLCGGGSRNRYLIERLTELLAPATVMPTDAVGLSADAKEAIAFAVLAHWWQLGVPGNLPEVTGACQPMCLGEIHLATEISRDTIQEISATQS